MNSSRPSARYHSCEIELLEVMALASRPAGPDNAVPSLPGSDSWLSKKKQKKFCILFVRSNIARLGGVKLHFRSLFLFLFVTVSFCLPPRFFLFEYTADPFVSFSLKRLPTSVISFFEIPPTGDCSLF